MAKSGKGTPAARALTGAERHERAVARLEDARTQVVAIEVQIADGATQLETLTTMAASAAKDVARAEHAEDVAAAALIENRAWVMLAENSDEEEAAKARHSELEATHETARKALDEARAALRAVQERGEREAAPLKAQQETLKRKLRDAKQLVAALERSVAEAHAQMGSELLADRLAQYRALDEQCEQATELAKQAEQARSTARDALLTALSDGGWSADLVSEAKQQARPAREIAAEQEAKRVAAEQRAAWEAEEQRKRKCEAAYQQRQAEERRRQMAIYDVRVALNAHLQGDKLTEFYQEKHLSAEDVEQALATIALRRSEDEVKDQAARRLRAGLSQ